MTAITIDRTYLPTATLGKADADSLPLRTIEKPWQNNTPMISCVPEGTYQLIPIHSPLLARMNLPSGDVTWALENEVLSVTLDGHNGTRSACLLHPGNWVEDSEGCILWGLASTPMLNPATGEVEPAIEESRQAYAALVAKLGALTTGHTLVIRGVMSAAGASQA